MSVDLPWLVHIFDILAEKLMILRVQQSTINGIKSKLVILCNVYIRYFIICKVYF